MKWNWLVASTAWAGIVGLAWWLADRRVGYCGTYHDDAWARCAVAAAATRDNALLWGGSIPLALFVLLTIAGHARIGPLDRRWRRRPSSNRELVPLERTEDLGA